jgi:predicted nucleic acid-binding protein
MRIRSPSTLRKTLSGKRVLVDSNIIIYLTDEVQPFAPVSRLIFQLIEKGDLFAIFSILSVAEVMQGPLRRGLTQNAMDAKTYLLNFPNTTCQAITTQVIDEIGKDQRIEWKRLRTIDALIIASGLVHGVELIVSNDSHFQAALPEDLVVSLT